MPHLSYRVEDDNQRAIPPNLPGHPAVRSNNGGTLLADFQCIEDSCVCYALSPYLSRGEDLDTKEFRLNQTTHRALAPLNMNIYLYLLRRSASTSSRTLPVLSRK